MRTPEEIIGADAVAALEAEGYVIAEPSDLFPIPMVSVTREQADAQVFKMLSGFKASTYYLDRESGHESHDLHHNRSPAGDAD